MVIKIDLTKVANAPIQSVYKYFSNVEELPRRHPNQVKNIKIVSREETGIVFEQESSLIGKKIRSTNKIVLYPDQNKIETEVIDGDGKGSKTTTIFSPANDTTQIKVEGDLHLGRLERLFSKAVKSTAEKLLNEDVKIIDSGLSE
jgi:carbon monoxide dehydrogenase subunit G